MSIAQLLAGRDAGEQSRMEAASDNPRRESASVTARRLAQTAIVIDCETTGFGGDARVWEIGLTDIPHITQSVLSLRCNPGLERPVGLGGGLYQWQQAAYEMARATLSAPQTDPSDRFDPSDHPTDPVTILQAEPVFADLAHSLITTLTDRDVCGWNVLDFDATMLQREYSRLGFAQYSQRWQSIRWWDLMALYLRWRAENGRPTASSNRISIEDACLAESVEPETVHRAESGVRCCVEILKKMAGEGQTCDQPV